MQRTKTDTLPASFYRLAVNVFGQYDLAHHNAHQYDLGSSVHSVHSDEAKQINLNSSSSHKNGLVHRAPRAPLVRAPELILNTAGQHLNGLVA